MTAATKRINLKVSVIGLSPTNNPLTVPSGQADELVNRGLASYVDLPPLPPSVVFVVGSFGTLSELEAAHPAADNAGRRALVGTSAPYIEYTCNGSVWQPDIGGVGDGTDQTARNMATTASAAAQTADNKATTAATAAATASAEASGALARARQSTTFPSRHWDMVANNWGLQPGVRHPEWTSFEVTVASGVTFDGLTLGVGDLVFWHEDLTKWVMLDNTTDSAILTDIADLRSTKPAAGTITQIVMGGRTGSFEAVYGDYTNECALDPYHAVWASFASDSVPGETGCHRRVGADTDGLHVKWAGLQFGDTDAVAADNGARANSIINIGRSTAQPSMPGGDTITSLIRFPDSGEFHYSGLDFTFIDWFAVRGVAPIYLRAPNRVGLDLGGASKGRFMWMQFVIEPDDAGTLAKLGVRLGRADEPGVNYPVGEWARKPAERNTFYGCRATGWASRWIVWNNASEGSEWMGGDVLNYYTGAPDTFDPLLMVGGVALDRFNDCDLGLASQFAPLTTPAGTANGTHNQNSWENVRIRCPGANVVPMYINGPQQLNTSRLSLVGGAKTFLVYGNGGQNEQGLAERTNYGNVISFHGESANDTVEQLYCVVLRTPTRDTQLTNFVFNELRGHATLGVFHVDGPNKVLLDNVKIDLRAVLGSNRNTHLFSPASLGKVHGYGEIYAEPVVDAYNTITVTTTAGSSIVEVDASNNHMEAGEVFDIKPLDPADAFTVVDGITIGGRYTLLTDIDNSRFTIDTGQMPTTGGVVGVITPGNISAAINRSRILDFDACLSSFDGQISAGVYPQFIRRPPGDNKIVGIGASALASSTADDLVANAHATGTVVDYDGTSKLVRFIGSVDITVTEINPPLSGQAETVVYANANNNIVTLQAAASGTDNLLIIEPVVLRQNESVPLTWDAVSLKWRRADPAPVQTGPIYTGVFSGIPGAGANAGKQAVITDVGVVPTTFVSDGTNWRTQGGRALLHCKHANSQASPITVLTGVTAGQLTTPSPLKVPAKLLVTGSSLVVEWWGRRVGANGTSTVNTCLGTTGTSADSVVDTFNLTAVDNTSHQRKQKAKFGGANGTFLTGTWGGDQTASLGTIVARSTNVNTQADMFVTFHVAAAHASDAQHLLDYAIWIES